MRRNRLRSVWDERVAQWDDTVSTSTSFARLRHRVLELAEPKPDDRCLDLGAGTGFLSVPLAGRTARVLAVDLSPEMLSTLEVAARQSGRTIATYATDIGQLRLPRGSNDLIVSSYAMHYLPDVDKRAVLRRAHDWLAPGGRLVIADMMVGRKFDEHHRRVFWEKALTMLRRGPAGWWRLGKNVVRIGSGQGRLRPCPPEWWQAAVTEAGFLDVAYEHVVSEAGIVTGRTSVTGSGQAESARMVGRGGIAPIGAEPLRAGPTDALAGGPVGHLACRGTLGPG